MGATPGWRSRRSICPEGLRAGRRWSLGLGRRSIKTVCRPRDKRFPAPRARPSCAIRRRARRDSAPPARVGTRPKRSYSRCTSARRTDRKCRRRPLCIMIAGRPAALLAADRRCGRCGSCGCRGRRVGWLRCAVGVDQCVDLVVRPLVQAFALLHHPAWGFPPASPASVRRSRLAVVPCNAPRFFPS